MSPSESSSKPSLGTSSQSVSEGFSSLAQDEAKGWIAKDLRDHDTCKMERLLRVFVARCREGIDEQQSSSAHSTPPTPTGPYMPSSPPSPTRTEKASTEPSIHPAVSAQPDSTPVVTDSDSANDNLFQRCLEAVLPICNSPDMKGLLATYCRVTGQEKARYPLFAETFNHALGELSKVKIAGLRSPSHLGVMFHLNDPMGITGDHGPGRTSTRVPDINIVSLAAARRASGHRNDTWKDCALTAMKHLSHSFSWLDVLTTLEFKKAKPTLPEPLDTYDISPLQSILPNPFGGDASDSTNSSLNPSAAASAQISVSRSGGSAIINHPATRSAKRKAPADPQAAGVDDASRATPKKTRLSVPKEDSNQKVRAAMIQSASYGAEMLCSSIGRCHAISLLILDEIAWVFWHDRQCPIQSEGINIVGDLPYFLVLLLAFQRFTLADWGFNTKLDSRAKRIHQEAEEIPTQDRYTLNFPRGIEVSINPRDVIYQRYSLVGRSTRVLAAASHSPHPRSHSSLANTKLVGKVYWPNVSRLSEERIITLARQETNSDHLPDVIGSLDEYLTKTIRKDLGVKDNSRRPSRVLRIIIFERLDPITKLQGEAFVRAWLECVRCHFDLWKRGVQHRDLSLSNLMLRTKGDQRLGVINDWDLSFVKNESCELGEHTGTISFLAMELLEPEYWRGEITVLYRHDLESFIWIAVWVFYCYDKGSADVPWPLKKWQTADFEQCRDSKSNFLFNQWKYSVKPGWAAEEPIVRRLLKWLLSKQVRAGESDTEESDVENSDAGELDTETPAVILAEFIEQLREAGKKRGPAYLRDLIDLMDTCLVSPVE